jgi:hypothetical protein
LKSAPSIVKRGERPQTRSAQIEVRRMKLSGKNDV